MRGGGAYSGCVYGVRTRDAHRSRIRAGAGVVCGGTSVVVRAGTRGQVRSSAGAAGGAGRSARRRVVGRGSARRAGADSADPTGRCGLPAPCRRRHRTRIPALGRRCRRAVRCPGHAIRPDDLSSSRSNQSGRCLSRLAVVVRGELDRPPGTVSDAPAPSSTPGLAVGAAKMNSSRMIRRRLP